MEYKKISDLNTVSGQLTERSYIPVVHGGQTFKVAATDLIKVGEYTVTLPVSDWNNKKITVSVAGVTSSTTQVILPLLATSSENIANNKALQTANIQDAGQSAGQITLYADKVPTNDLYIRVIVYV